MKFQLTVLAASLAISYAIPARGGTKRARSGAVLSDQNPVDDLPYIVEEPEDDYSPYYFVPFGGSEVVVKETLEEANIFAGAEIDRMVEYLTREGNMITVQQAEDQNMAVLKKYPTNNQFVTAKYMNQGGDLVSLHGVRFEPMSFSWKAQVQYRRKKYDLGSSVEPAVAALMYQQACIALKQKEPSSPSCPKIMPLQDFERFRQIIQNYGDLDFTKVKEFLEAVSADSTHVPSADLVTFLEPEIAEDDARLVIDEEEREAEEEYAAPYVVNDDAPELNQGTLEKYELQGEEDSGDQLDTLGGNASDLQDQEDLPPRKRQRRTWVEWLNGRTWSQWLRRQPHNYSYRQ